MELKKAVRANFFQVVVDGEMVIIYVLDDRGRLWASKDGGKAWASISLPQETL